ncbi:MAG TPA: TIGR03013 family XrtA/PEP-CTERM system glycosyltransferase [Vicinamibacterales bacterium]
MAKIFKHRVSWRLFLLIGAESALVIGAVVLAAWLRLGPSAWALMENEAGWWKAALVAAVCQLCLYYSDLYDLRIVADRRELFVRALQSLGAASLILAVLYYVFPELVLGRGVFFIAAAFAVAIIIGWRMAFEWLAKRARPAERLLLVGTGVAAVGLALELHDRRQELGVEIVGFVDPDGLGGEAPLVSPGIVGTIDDIPRIVRDADVDRVVVSLADARGKLPMDKLLDMKLSGVQFDHLATVYEEYTGKIAVENLRPSWLIFSEGFRKTPSLTAAKRAVDVVAATVGLLVAMPVMLLMALAIKLTSPGSVLYHQVRVGLQGRDFRVHKFRSMRADAEAATGAVWAKAGHDPRVTRVGRFLRRSRIDELPQLWNVLVGDMSFVGPRPERPEFVQDLTKQIPFYGQRHVLRPGVTGWAQVRYAYGASVEDSMEKLQYDLFYIKNLSLALDAYIILETIKTVLMRRGS